MALITENGWPQIGADMLDKGLIPGSTVVRLETRKGDVTTILKGWAAWYDRNVADIEFNYNGGERDDWAWSATNSVWNSNHLSGTAIDINATQWNMGVKRMPQWMVDKINEGLRLFEGTVFWGRNWTGASVDEMHFQIQGNAAQIAPFAAKLREGYLGLWAPEKPADPKDYPLPIGYSYGPLEGDDFTISGLYKSDSEKAKDGLGRWQEAAGIPVTRHWDEATALAVVQLQNELGWRDSPFYGRIYTGEWDKVVREGWKAPKPVAAESVRWNDVSQFQGKAIDELYPHRVFCFRINTGKQLDTLAQENYLMAQKMVDEGKLDMIIGYSFWRPDHDTFGVAERFLAANGGVHRKLALMIDVENGRGSALGEVKGDQSAGVNDYIERAIKLLGDPRRVCGYQNFVADPGMWTKRRADLKMIIPNYSLAPGKGRPTGEQFFAHQWTDKAQSASWPGKGVDENYFAGPLSAFLEAFGLANAPQPEPEPQPEQPGPKPDPTPAVPLTDGQKLDAIHWKETTHLGLEGRPVPATSPDDQLGQTLNVRAEVLMGLELMVELARQNGLDPDALMQRARLKYGA